MLKKKEFFKFGIVILLFLTAYYFPVNLFQGKGAITSMFDLLKWYAREHVILCLLPAFLIAGVISIFISQGAIIKYFGANAKKIVSYTIASVSGTILAVCSCTILPLFSSIYKRGAGLGPAVAFLYSGPAINILAIILTARILGVEIGIARIVGAVIFSVVIGSLMSLLYKKEEINKKKEQLNFPDIPNNKPLWQTSLHFFSLVLILIFANWGKPSTEIDSGLWFWIWQNKWNITGIFAIILGFSLIFILKLNWKKVLIGSLLTLLSAIIFSSPIVPVIVGIASLSIISLTDKENSENREWIISSWNFLKQILPLLALGVLIAGFLLGSTHDNVQLAGIIPNIWIEKLVGNNSIFSNFFAAIVGAFMYFATLTEVPILQGLISAGMGKGPALALLLAGPSLSLPNMLVIRKVMGTQKTIVYVSLVIIMATISGLLYGLI